MKRILLGSAMSVLMLASCDGGITYSSCVVTTTDSVVNSIFPNGICKDVEGGGFLLKSDAVSWCQEEVPPNSLAFVGVTESELVYEPQRTTCSSEEE